MVPFKSSSNMVIILFMVDWGSLRPLFCIMYLNWVQLISLLYDLSQSLKNASGLILVLSCSFFLNSFRICSSGDIWLRYLLALVGSSSDTFDWFKFRDESLTIFVKSCKSLMALTTPTLLSAKEDYYYSISDRLELSFVLSWCNSFAKLSLDISMLFFFWLL